MVAGKRGRPRKIPLPDGATTKNLKTPAIVKKEPQDEAGPSTSQTTGLVESDRDEPAPGEIIFGYDEEPEGGENGDAVVDVVNVESSTLEQTAREIFEPSPIDRRLRENRSYNEGEWLSTELKSLYDGITTYGTRLEALEVIQLNFCSTRTIEEVIAKVEEIRAINEEHREDRRSVETGQWTNAGYRNVHAIPQYVILPEINNWEAAIQRVNRQVRSLTDYPVRAAIENALSTKPDDVENPTTYKVTDYRNGRGYGKEQTVSWKRLGAFFAGVVKHERPLPPLNALECAIALHIVDDVEEEVSQTLTDDHKAIIRGWLSNIQTRHLRDFAPDTPYSATNAAAILLDPLRTRLWNIPPNGAELPRVVDEEMELLTEQQIEQGFQNL